MKAKTAKTKDALARVTMRLPQSLWDAVQHRAVDEHIQYQELVARALRAYLKGGRE
jgi:predicted DNA binding CopG/RHH family protein